MPDQFHQVRPAPAFEGQWSELGFSTGFLDEVLGSIVTETRLRMPRPDSAGLMWFERVIHGHERPVHGGGRVWIGCEARGDDLVLERLSTSDPRR